MTDHIVKHDAEVARRVRARPGHQVAVLLRRQRSTCFHHLTTTAVDSGLLMILIQTGAITAVVAAVGSPHQGAAKKHGGQSGPGGGLCGHCLMSANEIMDGWMDRCLLVRIYSTPHRCVSDGGLQPALLI
jgi:hypothetical protein